MLSRGRLLTELSQEGVTVLPGVPFLFDTLAGWEGAVDLSRARLCYSSGAGLRAPVHERFRGRLGIGIRQPYGSTETGLAAANCKSTDPAPWASVGAPGGDASVEVVGEGELLIRSSSLARGYLNAEAANRAAFVDGGLLTGDLGHLDAAGNVYITGRSKLILEVAGHKIDPVEVEDVLADHPAVAEAVVVGVPSPRTGEQRLKAVVVRRGDAAADALLRHCRERLSMHKVPELIEFRDEIPRPRRQGAARQADGGLAVSRDIGRKRGGGFEQVGGHVRVGDDDAELLLDELDESHQSHGIDDAEFDQSRLRIDCDRVVGGKLGDELDDRVLGLGHGVRSHHRANL